MQKPLQIIFHDLDKSDAIEAEITRRVAKLEELYERIIGCRVTVELEGRHQRQGKDYSVRVDLTVPGDEIIVGHNHSNEDVFVAIRDVFDAAKRRLEDFARRQRGEVKMHEQSVYESE